jgi:hypothetical protein
MSAPNVARYPRAARRAETSHTLCELCAVPIAEGHRHVVDIVDRRLLCSCAACALVSADAGTGRFRAVPRSVRGEASVSSAIGAEDLRALGVPVGLALFIRASRMGRVVVIFPSPAGATELEVPERAWAVIEAKSALVRTLRDDVEALLVRRRGDRSTTVLVVPIDAGYELIAILRHRWRGIDGGDLAREAVEGFLDVLTRRVEEP